MTQQETIAVLDAGGTMGRPMARNLAATGFAVRAWNRSREKAEDLASDGIDVVDTPAEAARGATMVLTIVADADAVLAAMEGDDGAAAAAGRGTVWLQMSTVGVEGAERCIAVADRGGLVLVDAPVIGTKQPAEAGELVVLASGPDDVRDRLEPVFAAVGKRTIWAGPAGAGSRLKVATNSWILALVSATAETLALAEGLGLEPEQVLDALSGGPLDVPYLQMKGRAMIQRSFEPSFKLGLAAKDARLVEEAAERSGLELPLVRAIRGRLEEGAREHADADMAATYLTSAPGG